MKYIGRIDLKQRTFRNNVESDIFVDDRLEFFSGVGFIFSYILNDSCKMLADRS